MEDNAINNDAYKRYMVFVYADYYPCGGLDDVNASFDDKNAALNYASENYSDSVYVFDRVLGVCVDDQSVD